MTEGNDIIRGLAGDDLLCGGEGDDTLVGGDDEDWLLGEGGTDILDGGAGAEDAAVFIGAPQAITASLVAGAAAGWGNDTLSAVEDLVGSDFADRLTGDGGENLLDGRKGDDRLVGGGQNDLLDGDAGSDVLEGGAGFDLVFYDYAPRGVRVDLTRRVATGWGTDRLLGIEDVDGSRFADLIAGDGAEKLPRRRSRKRRDRRRPGQGQHPWRAGRGPHRRWAWR